MATKRVLFISGSVGLGHVHRDLAIAAELCRRRPEVGVQWLASPSVVPVLREAGQEVLPEAEGFGDDSLAAERATNGFSMDVVMYTVRARKEWARNVEVFRKITSERSFDLVIGDETYEIGIALFKKPKLKKSPYVEIYDFVGNDAMSHNPLERMGTYYWNMMWVRMLKHLPRWGELALFVGEEADVPDVSFGPFLPNRRELARRTIQFVGYVLPFDPARYAEKAKVRAELGYGDEPLMVACIGGTAIGKDLLTLCARAYPILQQSVTNLRLVLVCGPRLPVNSLEVPEGVHVCGYVPDLYKHLAASDLCVVQGGGAITLELTALRRPFLYFPLEGHFEQQVHVAGRLQRHGAGLRMDFSRTTPEILAEQVVANLGQEVRYPPIRTDGAGKAAELIARRL